MSLLKSSTYGEDFKVYLQTPIVCLLTKDLPRDRKSIFKRWTLLILRPIEVKSYQCFEHIALLMAEGVGADPTYPVLETGAFAAMLPLNITKTHFFCCLTIKLSAKRRRNRT